MNEIKIFSSAEFGDVRTVLIEGEPWFVGNDIARVLEYKDLYSAIRHNVDDDDKTLCPVGSSNGTQNTVIVNESGLYSMIFCSKLPKAKAFKKWVTSEVLPQIRKTGKYEMSSQPSYQIENPAERARAWAREYEERQKLEQKIEADKPGILYYEKCTEKKINTNFRDTAKELDMSQTQLTGWLLEMGYVYRAKDKALLPYEPYMKSGLFVVKDFLNPYGYSGRQAYVTPNGKAHLQLLLELDGIEPRSKKKHGGRKRNR